MVTTEIAQFPVVAGSDISDPKNPAAVILKASVETLKKQDGNRSIHVGMQVEAPDWFQMMIDWDGIHKHEEFRASSAYPPFLAEIRQMLGENGSIFHVDFQPAGALEKMMAAPVTEVATFYFDGTPPPDHLDNVKKVADILQEAKVDGYLGYSAGITHEEIEREGVKGKAVVLAIGWESVQKHLDFRGTQLFKDNIQLLRGNAQKIEMHHVDFTKST